MDPRVGYLPPIEAVILAGSLSGIIVANRGNHLARSLSGILTTHK